MGAADRVPATDDTRTDDGSAWDAAVERQVGSPLREAVASGRNSAGVLVFVRDGAIHIAEGFGFEDSSRANAVTASNSRFILNSISKAFVAVALAQLKSRGRIKSYDDPANQYLRTYRLPDSAGRQITLKQLATHTAGIDEAVFGMQTPKPIPRAPHASDYLAHQPRYFMAPGLMPVYSELGIDLLGLVIADTVGESYAEYLNAEVLAPFGMSKSSVGYPGGGAIPHLVTAYQPDSPNNVEPAIYSTPMTLPDGGVISTGEDMGRFIMELSRPAYSDVFHIQKTLDSSTIAYGIVFEITHVRGRLIAYHRGGGRGTDCIVAFALTAGAGVFECATTVKPIRGTPPGHQPVTHEIFDLAVFDSLAPAPPDSEASSSSFAAPPSKSKKNAAWDDYVGDYVGTSRHHFGIGRLRSLLHPYGVRVRRGSLGLRIDEVDGFQELSPGHFGAPDVLENFTFLKSPVDGRILLSRSLDGTPFEKPLLRDDPRVMDSLLAAFVTIAATGLIAPFWPRRDRHRTARIAAAGFAVTALTGVAVLYGFHTFGFRYSVGITWPVWVIRTCGFLIIPTAGILLLSVFKPDGQTSARWSTERAARLHLILLAMDAIAGIGLLTSVGVIGLITQ